MDIISSDSDLMHKRRSLNSKQLAFHGNRIYNKYNINAWFVNCKQHFFILMKISKSSR